MEKKVYQTPTMKVVKLSQKTQLLDNSTRIMSIKSNNLNFSYGGSDEGYEGEVR